MSAIGGMKEKLILAAAAIVAWFTMVLLVILAASPAGTLSKQDMETVVKVLPSKDILSPGETFTVAVRVEPGDGGVNVAGAQFDLAFNHLAVRLDAVEEGDLLKQGGAQTFFMAGTLDNQAGTVTGVAQVILGAGQSVAGPGNIAVLHCTALAAGQTSAFVISNVIVGNMAAEPLPLESPIINQVTVASPSDLDLDGDVDVNDLVMVATVFGATGAPGFRREDVKGDGKIDVLDMIVVGQNIA
jgi:hypothetical protein